MNKKKHELYVKHTATHSALLDPRQVEDFIGVLSTYKREKEIEKPLTANETNHHEEQQTKYSNPHCRNPS